MATNVFDVFGRILLDSSDFDAGIDRAKNKASSFGSIFSSAAKIGMAAIGAATTAVAGFATASVNAGSDFDTSMSQVAATMGKTVDEITELRDFAQEMGRTTAFSATQAADALNYMALAGYDAETSMSMLPNVLNLAAAGAMDLATASDMITDTQTAFGISLERTTQMVDEMAKAASTGNTNVSQLGSAFLTIGGLAQELNGGMVKLSDGTTQTVDGIQELEIALTAMANAGVKGSEAGTHMRNMLLKLASPTSDGTKALEAMGVKVFDTAGNMRSLSDVFGDLNDKLTQMTQEQKIQTISDLFNTRDLAAAEALLNAVGEDWDKIGESILDAEGAASKMAETQLDNLAGDITLFKSALEGAEIAVSDKLTPALRDFVQFGTSSLSDLTASFTEGGLDAAVEKFGDILSNGITTIIEKSPQIIKAGTKLLTTLIKGFIKNKDKLKNAAKEIVDVIFDTLSEEFPSVERVFSGLKNVFDGVFGFIEKNGPLIQAVIEGIVAGFLTFKVVTGILSGVQTGIELVSAAQKVLNGEMALTALVNPYVAIAAGVAALTAAVVILTEKERAEFEQHLEEIGRISEADQERINKAQEYSKALEDVYGKNKEVKQSVDEQYLSELALRDELAQIVDANGNIKKGYEERADVIMTQLNDAFDIELEKQGNVITNYDTEMAKIDQIIEKKKAEALIDAGKEEYANALRDQVGLMEDMNSIQDEYNATYKEYEGALQRSNEAYKSLYETTNFWKQAEFAKEYDRQRQEADALKTKLNELENGIYETQKAYYAGQDYIKDYETLMSDAATGADTLNQSIGNMTNGIIEKAPEKVLKRQAEEATNYLDSLLKAFGKGAGVTEQQIEEATQRAYEAVTAWQGAGEEASEGYAVGLAESNNAITNARALVDDALEALRIAQDSHSPSREYKKEGINAISGYRIGMEEEFPNLLNMLGENLSYTREYFTELVAEAAEWGTDMMNNFIESIKAAIPSLTATAAQVAAVVKNNIGFSEPKEGPLSDFHTYAPDMMNLFAEGIRENADVVTDAIADSFDFSDSITTSANGYDQIYQTNTSGQLSQVVALLKDIAENGLGVEFAPEADGIFRVVEKENRRHTKATGYNTLAQAGG